MVSKYRVVVHEHKALVALLLISVCLLLTVLSILGYPDEDNEGSGPLAVLRGINFIVLLLSLTFAVVGLYVFYRFSVDKSKFESLINSKSQAIFKKNQLEIERLALRLTSKEEKIVLDLIRKYKIK
jgi:hypothetical protein